MRNPEEDEATTRTRFRDYRFFHVDDPNGNAAGWYFEIRDGSPRGPFSSQHLAEVVLAHYVNAVCEAGISRPESVPITRIYDGCRT